MTDRARPRLRIITLIPAALLAFLVAVATANAATNATYRDDFRSGSYSGNDGTQPWVGSWQESGEADGPHAGVFQVDSDGCASGCLSITAAPSVSARTIRRSANLAGATSARLTITYKRELLSTQATHSADNDTVAKIVVRVFDGSSWSNVTSIVLGAGDNEWRTQTFDVSDAIDAATAIGFDLERGGLDAVLRIDTVVLEAGFAAEPPTAPTTTTSAPPSTTTTTTTSAPPSTTTTTTTSAPPSTTTTTAGPAPTTTAPPTTPTTHPTPTTTTTVPTAATAIPPPPAVDPPSMNATDLAHYRDKADMVTVANPEPDADAANLHARPATELRASLVSATRTIRRLAVPAILLGILIGLLAVRGLDDYSPWREGTQKPPPPSR